MVEKIFFQCSLPRSGSTLLQNILAQNPDFYASPTSGLVDLVLSARNTFTNGIEFKAQEQKIVTPAFKSFCREGMFGYYNAITDKKYVIDKSRGWCGVYEFLDGIYPNPKIIIMVRDLRSIVSSLEKKWRENQHADVGDTNWNSLKNTTVDKRINYFLTQSPPLAVSVDVIYETLIRKISKKCLFIKFENFCINPEREIKRIYEYLELPHFQHNFNNIEQKTFENDSYYFPFGDHMIKKSLQPINEDYVQILGKHNCDLIFNSYQWFFKAFDYTN